MPQRLGDTATFGLSIGANSDDGRWTGALFVRNLTDKRTPAFVFQSPIGLFTSDALFGTGTYTQQYSADSFRTIGVSLGYRM